MFTDINNKKVRVIPILLKSINSICNLIIFCYVCILYFNVYSLNREPTVIVILSPQTNCDRSGRSNTKILLNVYQMSFSKQFRMIFKCFASVTSISTKLNIKTCLNLKQKQIIITVRNSFKFGFDSIDFRQSLRLKLKEYLTWFESSTLWVLITDYL